MSQIGALTSPSYVQPQRHHQRSAAPAGPTPGSGDGAHLSAEAHARESMQGHRMVQGMQGNFGSSQSVGRVAGRRGVSRRRRAHGSRATRRNQGTQGTRRTRRSHPARGAQRIQAGPNNGPVNANRLARDAESIARSGRAGRGRNCFRGVKWALARQGVNLSGVPAYGAANQLARNSNFHEQRGLSRQDLPELPAGSVVVWGQGRGHRYGHISVSTGDGREASDVMRQQITNYPSSYRVFMPN